MNIHKITTSILLLVSVLVPIHTLSAQANANTSPRIYIEAPTRVSVGSEFVVKVLVDSESPINAMEIALTYPGTFLKPSAFNESSSIIQLWQDKDWRSTPGKIMLSGGIPRAFAGNKGEVGRLTFKAVAPGDVTVSFTVADTYYADGLGTRTTARTSPVRLSVFAVTPGSPQVITTTVVQDEALNSDTQPPVFGLTDTLRNHSKGNHLAIFEVKDTGSGIAKVEIRTNSLVSWSDWHEVTNPAEVRSGTFKYQLRATDNTGNITVETFYIRSKLILILSIVILSFAFLAGAIYFIIKR